MKRSVALLALGLALCLAGCASRAEPTVSAPGQTAPAASAPSLSPPPVSTPALTTPPVTTPAPTQPPPEITQPEPQDDAFVRVIDYIPDMAVELRYATEHNFTGQRIYDFSQVWLRYGTVKKLMAVQQELGQQGLSLKLWDGFRPPSANSGFGKFSPTPSMYPTPTRASAPTAGAIP